ncbi:MAG: sugar phosphate isomerase/epimerase [Nitrososphaeria archaeon]|nr:sugar phosphate isomerase/epimerase [Nitrososphaeria archaeon]
MKIGLPVFWFSDLVNELTYSAGESYPKQVFKAAKLGFQHIELVLNTHYFFKDSNQLFSKECIRSLLELKEQFKLSYSIHLPFWSVDPSSHIDEIRNATIKVMSGLIEKVIELDPITYVLHATGEFAAEVNKMKLATDQKEFLMNFFAAKSRIFVKQLIENLSQLGVPSKRLALESVKFPFKYSIAIAKEFGTTLCVDVGHIVAGFPGDVNLKEAFELSKDRISEIHIHDVVKRVDEGKPFIKDHLPLGSGILDISEVLDLVKEVNFCGPLVLELKFEDAVNSKNLISLNLK